VNPYDIIFMLTRREVDVCRQIAEYRTPLQIAATLRVTRRSVYNYERNIRDKLGVSTRCELIQRLQPFNQEMSKYYPKTK